MHVEHEGHKYSIRFNHEQFSGQKWCGWTGCLIYRREDPFPVAHAEAFCSVKDQYVKETGRRLTLKRAVAALPRTLRGKLLHAYFTRHRNGGGA